MEKAATTSSRSCEFLGARSRLRSFIESQLTLSPSYSHNRFHDILNGGYGSRQSYRQQQPNYHPETEEEKEKRQEQKREAHERSRRRAMKDRAEALAAEERRQKEAELEKEQREQEREEGEF